MKKFNKQYSGTALPYAEALKQDIIEMPIAALVKALNIDSVCGTRASCAGHGWTRISNEVPFVYMVCELEWSFAMAQTLDRLIRTKQLHYHWALEGFFVSDVGLCWDLRIADSRFFRYRKKIDKDFATFTHEVQQLAPKFQQRIVLGDETVGKEQHNDKDDHVGKPFGLHDFSQGVGVFAFRAFTPDSSI
jgi:hypothetical protein